MAEYQWQNHSITVIRSNRKSIQLEITAELEIKVRAPWNMTEYQVRRFLQEREEWLASHYAEIAGRRSIENNEPVEEMTPKRKAQLVKAAKILIPNRVEYYSHVIGVSYNRISIRMQKTRWGSCSSEGNLNFNCLLVLAPLWVTDYVVVHELCHRIYMDHSKAFWQKVESIYPRAREAKQWLHENGMNLASGRIQKRQDIKV